MNDPNTKSKSTVKAAEHYLCSPNHTANDMQLIPIEKKFLTETICKAREAFFIQKGRTIDPGGLNIRQETYTSTPIKEKHIFLRLSSLLHNFVQLIYLSLDTKSILT